MIDFERCYSEYISHDEEQEEIFFQIILEFIEKISIFFSENVSKKNVVSFGFIKYLIG